MSVLRVPHIVISGAIWQKPRKIRSQIIRRVCSVLEREYGIPRLENPTNSLDDLIFIILSNKTSPEIAMKTYEDLIIEFSIWDDVLLSAPSVLLSILKPAGLAIVKSKQIISALEKIKKDVGTCDLSFLQHRPEKYVREYLISLPGVSEKVAKCVMLYTLDTQVLPVDSHVYRVTKRLGWTARKRADQCHEELEALVPPKRRFAFHVDCILHGRKICRPNKPACNQCCISHYCAYFQGLSSNG